MIPFSILSGQLYMNKEQRLEIRILDLAPDEFTFRLSNKRAKHMTADKYSICLQFYCLQKGSYEQVELKEEIIRLQEHEFFTVFSVKTENRKFEEYSTALSKEYLAYIRLKLEEEDGEISRCLTGYPAEKEKIYMESFLEQKKKMFQIEKREETFDRLQEVWRQPFEFAIHLDHPHFWKEYLKMPAEKFQEKYFRENGLSGHPAAERKIDLLYLGSQVCIHLVPEWKIMKAVMEKAESEGLNTVVVIPPLNENSLAVAELLLKNLKKWSGEKKKAELVVNDWGMLQILKEYQEYFCIALGTMPVKMKKDVRIEYVRNGSSMKESEIWPEDFRKMLEQKYGVRRYAAESVNRPFWLPGTPCSMHMPFYQMNTAAYCTLAAAYRYADRGKQHPTDHCAGICKDYLFQYPDMLHMVGKYNSLYGCERKSLWDDNWLRECLEQGVDRIVWNLL